MSCDVSDANQCDEGRPSCGRCRRSDGQCSLAFLTPISFQKPKRTRPEGGQNLTCSPQYFQPAFMDTDSLELFHHYTTATCLILSRSRNIDIWQVAIPRMALQHAFLMHGILALSALHLSRMQPLRTRKLTFLASAHEQAALPSFRKHISQSLNLNNNNETCDAVFSFSGFVIPFILASESASMSRIPGLEDAAPHWFHAIRGLMVLLSGNWSTLSQGLYNPLLLAGGTSAPVSYAHNPNDSHLVEVQNLMSSYDFADVQESVACQIALDELRRILSPCKTTVGFKAAFLIWPSMVPIDYIRLLHLKHPIALIILAHYCVLIKKIETVWYLRGLGQNLLSSIHEVLEPKWRPWLEWPMEQPVCWE
jgi:hypothetical protein